MDYEIFSTNSPTPFFSNNVELKGLFYIHLPIEILTRYNNGQQWLKGLKNSLGLRMG